MFKLRINGVESDLVTDGTMKFTDFIELVKATIDPEHMITAIYLDDAALSVEEWSRNVNQVQGAILDIITGSPVQYLNDRLEESSGFVRSCFFAFREARKDFQDGDMNSGNKKLKVAVDNLKAFFEWYGTLVELAKEENKTRLDLSPQVKEITEVCKRICQQQLYQSWWALGESLEKDLEPKLDKLEDACRKAAKLVQAAAA